MAESGQLTDLWFQKKKVKLRLNQEKKWQNLAEKNSQLSGKSARKAARRSGPHLLG